MKTFVIKNKEGKYYEGLSEKWYDSLDRCTYFKNKESAEYERKNLLKLKNCEIIEITIAEGDLEQENAKLKSELEGKVDYWEWQNNMAKTKHIEILEKDIEIYKKALELACKNIIRVYEIDDNEGFEYCDYNVEDFSKFYIKQAKESIDGK